MARPSLFTHRKLRILTRLIGCKARAIGSLELIWHAGYQDGDARLGTSDDVESAASWRGTKGKLTSSLCAAGFVDALDDDTYQIHDLLDHAPDYVKKRRAREQERRSVTSQCPVSDQSVSTTPIPSHPAPIPTTKTNTTCAARTRVVVDPAGFAEAWKAYPHYETRSSRKASAQVWSKLGLSEHAPGVLAWIGTASASDDWTRENGRFVPGMQVWLKSVDAANPPVVETDRGRPREIVNRMLTEEEKAARQAAREARS